MSRHDPARLIAENYPHRMEVQTRFQDMDVMGHLNNVAYAALFEHARVLFNRSMRPWKERPEAERSVLGRVEIDYLAEGRYPHPVEVCTAIGRIGNSSYTIVQAMFQKGECIALSESVSVVRTHGEAKPLRAEVVAALNASLIKG